MASFKGKLHPELAPFNNLEIKGSWNGNEFDPVDLLISVEVRCVPKTKLQLLNLHPEYISFTGSSIRRQPGKWSQDVLSVENLRNPLFCPVSSDEDKKNHKNSPSPLVSNEFVHGDAQPPLTTIPEESSTGKSGLSSGGPLSLDSVAGQEEDVYSTEPATDTSSIPDTGSFSQGSSGRAVSEGRWSNSGLMEPPGFPIGLEETASRLLHHNVTESDDISVPQNLGKRSAVDACLSDIEENEKRMICRTVPPSDEPRNVSIGSSSSECDAPGFPKGLLDNANNRVNKHQQKQSHKASFIPRRVRSTDRHASESSSTESQLDDPGVASHGANDTKVSNIDQSDGNIDSAPQDGDLQVDGGPIFTPTSGAPEALSEIGFDFGEILNPQSKVASDELLNSDTDEESQIGVDANSPGLPSLEESSKNDLQPTISSTTDKRGQESSAMNDSVTELDAGTKSRFPAPASNGSFILSTETKPTSDDEDVGSPKLSTPVKPLQTISPSTPISDSRIVVSVTELGDEDPFENPTPASENLPTTEGRVIEDEVCENFGSPTPVKLPKFKAPVLPDKRNASMGSFFEQPSQPMQEPRLDLFNGILVISNPLYGNLSTYKVTITVQVELQRGRIGGWNRLRVPGLPRMKNGENGWFLFQMPDYLGMEFQTTNFGRHNFIEDCFFAELVQCGDLVVPLRLCLRSFYGTVRDFTVDQEIMSEHVTHKRTQNLALVYNAMCSLRLYKHCFWAERCRFYLWIDGGPEGDYHCEVDPSNESPAFLCLPSNDRPIGVSCIQIVCSPKDLGAFCLSWCAECRCEEGLEWLPRIYSAPVLVPGRNGHGLREMLSNLSSNFITKTILDPLDVRKGDIRRGFPQTAGPNNHVAAQTESRQESVNCLSLQRMIFRRRFIPVTMIFALILLGLAVIHRVHSESMDFVRNPTLFSNSTLGFEFWTRARATNEEHHSGNDFHTHEMNFSEESGKVDKVSMAGEDKIESATPDVEPIKMDDKDKPELEMTAPERKLSWRDRLDYFLGWEGPAKRPAKRQISG